MQLLSWKAVTDVLCSSMDIRNNGTSYLAATAEIKVSCYFFNHYTAVCVAHCPFLYFVCYTLRLGIWFYSLRYVIICYCEMCTFLSIHNVVWWVVTPYRLLGGNQCFGGACIFTVHVEVK